MVHNGIEYGLMEAYAEEFELMHHSTYPLDLTQIAGIWRHGSVVRSWLLDLLYEAFEEHGATLDDIAGYVEDSGEGRWTINEAIEAAVPVPVIAASLFARFSSRRDINFAAKVSAALRNQFGGHAVRAARRSAAQAPRPTRGDEAMTTATESPLTVGLGLRGTPVLRARHLRRVGRPDKQSSSRALFNRGHSPAPRAVRDRRLRPVADVERRLPQGDGGDPEIRP